jgi:hypothetical protein
MEFRQYFSNAVGWTKKHWSTLLAILAILVGIAIVWHLGHRRLARHFAEQPMTLADCGYSAATCGRVKIESYNIEGINDTKEAVKQQTRNASDRQLDCTGGLAKANGDGTADVCKCACATIGKIVSK